MGLLVHELLSRTAAALPDKNALLFNNSNITYGELDRMSNRLRNLLSDIGAKPQDRIGICMPRSIHSILGAFGILKAGAVYVPIDPFAPESRLNYIVSKCEIAILIISRDQLAKVSRTFSEDSPLKSVIIMDGVDTNLEINPAIRLLWWAREQNELHEAQPPAKIEETELSYILFTSGSTGNPKGVMLSHRNAMTFINMACKFFDISDKDIFSNISPLHFDLSVFELYVAISAGATIAIIPESISIFPSKLAEFIEKNKITVWNSVPSALSLLATYANLDTFDLSSLRLVLFAGEVFPVKYLRQLLKNIPGAQFYNIYGQTEANSSTYYLVDNTPGKEISLLPIGKSFPDFEVFALDENGREITDQQTKGELYVRSATIASGYWKDPEQSRQKFIENPLFPGSGEMVYKTGDIVRLDSDGNFVFLGRVDHMIKSRGYRIEIGEIEMVLTNHPQVKIAVVIPIPDDLIGNRIAAIIVPSEGSTLGKEELVRHCSKLLPKYMVPEIVEIRDALPMTSSGKADRKKLGVDMAKIYRDKNVH